MILNIKILNYIGILTVILLNKENCTNLGILTRCLDLNTLFKSNTWTIGIHDRTIATGNPLTSDVIWSKTISIEKLLTRIGNSKKYNITERLFKRLAILQEHLVRHAVNVPYSDLKHRYCVSIFFSQGVVSSTNWRDNKTYYGRVDALKLLEKATALNIPYDPF